MESLSSKEVASQVLSDLKARNLNRAAVARRIGTSPQSFYNMLTGASRFSSRTAELLHAELGYSIDFLTRGVGTLLPDTEVDNLPLAGLYLHEESGLTDRETLLNESNKAFVKLYTIADKLTSSLHKKGYTASLNGLISKQSELLSNLDFEPRSNLELQLMNSLIGTYYTIITLLDPSRIVEDLKQLEEKIDESGD